MTHDDTIEEQLTQCRAACRELIRIQGEQALLLQAQDTDAKVGAFIRKWDIEKYREIVRENPELFSHD